LRGSTAAFVNGKIYVIGGFVDEAWAIGTRIVFAFDPATGVLSDRAPLERQRFLAAGAALNGKIYLAGGRTECYFDGYCPAPASTLEIYDPVTDRWSNGPPMTEARALAGAAILDGKLYVAGGTTGDSWWLDGRFAITSMEMYDPVTNTWSQRAPLPVGGPVQLAAANTTLYAFEWGDGTAWGTGWREVLKKSRVYAYDPGADSWSRLADAPALLGPAVAAVNGRLYVFGGYEMDATNTTRLVSHRVYVLNH
jgi:N-acetylneuraminic acid mutarotase